MSVAKSIRIPDDIYEYIDAYNGDGFNQKFCNIIRDARDTEAERNAVVSRLDKQVCERRKYLDETSQQLSMVSKQLYSMYLDMYYGN